jgi:hypothetical protein
MITIGHRIMERQEVIFSDREKKKMIDWFARTGFVPVEEKPLHRFLYSNIKLRCFGKKRLSKVIEKPFQLVKGMKMFTVERPYQRKPNAS